MPRRQPACWSFCAMAQAMLRLLAKPKITAVFCESVTFSSWLASCQLSDVSCQHSEQPQPALLNAGVSESCSVALICYKKCTSNGLRPADSLLTNPPCCGRESGGKTAALQK